MYYPYPETRTQTEGLATKNIVQVNGAGMVTAIPTQVSVNIGVITEGKDVTIAQKENSETMTKINAVLNSFSIPQKNVQTIDYRVDTEYDYENGKQVFRGYRVTHLLKVKLENVNEIGKLINKVIEAGANYVSNVQFLVSNPSYYYLQALNKALTSAHEKAQTITTHYKVNWTGIPFHVEELGTQIEPIQPQMTYVKGVNTDQFQPGTLQFNSTVLVKYRYI